VRDGLLHIFQNAQRLLGDHLPIAVSSYQAHICLQHFIDGFTAVILPGKFGYRASVPRPLFKRHERWPGAGVWVRKNALPRQRLAAIDQRFGNWRGLCLFCLNFCLRIAS